MKSVNASCTTGFPAEDEVGEDGGELIGNESGEKGDDEGGGKGGLEFKVLPEVVWRRVCERGHEAREAGTGFEGGDGRDGIGCGRR